MESGSIVFDHQVPGGQMDVDLDGFSVYTLQSHKGLWVNREKAGQLLLEHALDHGGGPKPADAKECRPALELTPVGSVWRRWKVLATTLAPPTQIFLPTVDNRRLSLRP